MKNLQATRDGFGQAMLELGKTNRYLVRKTKESLNKVGANILGVVLNRAAKRRGYYKSGYYYGHKTDQKTDKPKVKVLTYNQ